MIIVRVELHSAVTRKVTEIARLSITNDGAATRADPKRGDYAVHSYVGRDAAALDRKVVNRAGSIRDWPRLDRHVWHLVHAALAACGYGGRNGPADINEGKDLPNG